MLHYDTLDEVTLELLRQLTRLEILQHMRLVGGTALALQYGHRKSVDLDFFGKLSIEPHVLPALLQEIDKTVSLKRSPNINSFSIGGIKVDIVNYPYRWIGRLIEIDGVRMADPKDIAAMKLAAITNRGTRKDFIDFYFLLQHFSFEELIAFYLQKYEDASIFLVLKSLVYFEDAENDPIMPQILTNVAWAKVKEVILKEHHNYLKG